MPVKLGKLAILALAVCCCVLFGYFLWGCIGLYLSLSHQPTLKQGQAFFYSHENEIEQLREMILSEKAAHRVRLDQIGRFSKDPSDQQWYALDESYRRIPASEERVFTDMNMTHDRFAHYLTLFKQTGLKGVSKRLLEQDFDKDSVVADDPQYNERLAAAPKESIYVSIEYLHPNASMGGSPLNIVYAPKEALVPIFSHSAPRSAGNLKGNWYLAWE
jgi:hypothetical protein